MQTLPGAGNTSYTFTLDALGRPVKRTFQGGGDDIYAYVGTGETAWYTDPVATNAVTSALGPDESRLAVTDAASFAWLLPDLHGNVAAGVNLAETTVSHGWRYDGYGRTVTGSSTSALNPWKYQGRLDVSPDSANPLYDAGARFYDPNLGAFTQLDSYAGSAQDPLSLNRYLYAGANPSTLIDPTGHYFMSTDDPNTSEKAVFVRTRRPSKRHGSELHQIGRKPRSTAIPPHWRSRSEPAESRAVRDPCSAAKLNCFGFELQSMSVEDRLSWLDELHRTYGAEYGVSGYFNNISGILRFASSRNLGSDGGWFATVDAFILEAIQDGLRQVRGSSGSMWRNVDGSEVWANFFRAGLRGASTDDLRGLWGAAEQAATNFGVAAAQQRGLSPTDAERAVLVGAGDIYRQFVANPDEARGVFGSAGMAVGAGPGLVAGLTAPCPGWVKAACAGGGLLVGSGSGYFAGSSLADAFLDPTSGASETVAGWLYDGHLAWQNTVPR